MPVIMTTKSCANAQTSCASGLCANASAECVEKASKSLRIGLVNNMPDAALEATERQFISLIDASSEGLSVRLSFHSLPGIPRNDAGASRISRLYTSVENLWGAQLDGMIVTGREPSTEKLSDEPYWKSFTELVEWAQDNTYSTVWSCLAVHATVLSMDAVSRVRNSSKHSGIFDCARLTEHPLMASGPTMFKLPHSRWNGLDEDRLRACGYQILTRAADVGVDTFVKDLKSMFVFFQGHPEYEANALLLEYRRDIGRYVRGETSAYPTMPLNYFDADSIRVLKLLEERAKAGSSGDIMAEATSILGEARIENTWHSTAVGIYRNWLQIISAKKRMQLNERRSGMDSSHAAEELPLVASNASRPDIYAGPSTTSTASRNMLTIL